MKSSCQKFQGTQQLDLFSTSRRGRGRFLRCQKGTIVKAATEKMAIKLQQYDFKQLSQQEIDTIIQRPRIDFSEINTRIAPILEAVRTEGDTAVNRYTSQFDKVDIQQSCVPIEDLPPPELPETVTKALDTAYQNIKAFHVAQATPPLVVETMPGVTCQRVSRPIEKVGIYVPGGTAVLPSTALMLATPAGIAGCKTVVLATPPTPQGSVTPEVLYCARLAGVTHILLAGGAQAVAALAYGTQSCPKVHKILGPGNQYVTAAKMQLQTSEALVAIDMPAGPSEVMVVADGDADAAFVASDLLSQAEHGADSQVVLVALPGANVEDIEAEVARQCAELPREDVTRGALSHSYVIRVPDQTAALTMVNAYAPEHLIINTKNSQDYLKDVINAGSVFIGPWTPESVGDYASGTNHTLPTYGYARMYSGVSLDSFQRKMTVQELSKDGLRALGPTVEVMAECEGLAAHKQAVTLRLNKLKEF